MKNETHKRTQQADLNAAERVGSSAVRAESLPGEAFLEEAKKESKRGLLMDHIKTIQTLRDEKRFTFRGIAEWLGKRGIETDHSAVYRAYLAAIPVGQRHPDEDWSETDEPCYGDEEASVKKSGK